MNDERPSDEAIVQHMERVRAHAQQANEQTPIGLLERIDETLAHELDGGAMQGLHKQLIDTGYTHMRRSLNDGSCFYRAFVFALLEQLAGGSGKTQGERASACTMLLRSLESQKAQLSKCGFESIVYEDGMALLQNRITGIRDGNASVQSLEDHFCVAEEDKLNEVAHMLMVLRLVVSAEMRSKAGMYEPFLMLDDSSATDVHSFCSKFVEPMSEEADSAAIVALVNALNVKLTIMYMAPGTLTPSTFEPSNDNKSVPHVQPTLLYRPGHYDVLQQKQQ